MGNPYQSSDPGESGNPYLSPDRDSQLPPSAGYGPQSYGQPGVGYSGRPTPSGPGRVDVGGAFTQLGEGFGRFLMWVLLQGTVLLVGFFCVMFAGFILLFAAVGVQETEGYSETSADSTPLTTGEFVGFTVGIVVLILVLLLIAAMQWVLAYNLAHAVADSRDTTVRDAFCFRRFGAFLGIMFIGFFLMLLTLITIIGPVIVLYVLSFSLAALSEDDECGVFESIGRSWAMIKGDFSGTFLLNLCSAAIGYVAAAIGLSFYSLPFAAMLHIIGYRQYHGIVSLGLMPAYRQQPPQPPQTGYQPQQYF